MSTWKICKSLRYINWRPSIFFRKWFKNSFWRGKQIFCYSIIRKYLLNLFCYLTKDREKKHKTLTHLFFMFCKLTYKYYFFYYYIYYFTKPLKYVFDNIICRILSKLCFYYFVLDFAGFFIKIEILFIKNRFTNQIKILCIYKFYNFK